MALDVDDRVLSQQMLAEHGISIDALFDAPDAVTIESGKQGHGKLLYAMPFGLVLPRKQVYADKAGVRTAAFDFRCASSVGTTVQDVLPPSIHPDTGKPYSWGGRGHWSRLPFIPPSLLGLWQSMLETETRAVVQSATNVPTSWKEVKLALMFISPDCTRKEWIDIGMALHWAGTQSGEVELAYQLWDDWSSQGTKYPGARNIHTQWRCFTTDKPNTVTMGTFWHLAKQSGWQPPKPDVSEFFQAVGSPTPVVLLDDLSLIPPDIDLSLFPKVLATRAQEISDAVGCDPLVPLFSGLGAICSVTDARSRLELVDGFKVPPILWLMTIGNPADKKTPGSKPMMSTLKELEQEDRPRHAKALLEWEAKEAAYAASKKAFIEFSVTSDAQLGTAPPAVADLPPQPPSLKLTISDITSQKLIRHAAERPQGTLCYLDEMSTWVKKLTDKMSGEDRSAWVMSYESQPYDMDRVGGGSINCENLAISVYGNIQPRVLKESLSSLTSDGLLQRFIPAVLRSEHTRLGHPVPEYMTSKAQWDQTIRTIHALPATNYRLSDAARQVFRDFQVWYEDTKRDERLAGSGDMFMTAFGKLEGTVGRLVLVFHIIEQPFSNLVDVSIVDRVVTFAKQYLIPAFRYVFSNDQQDSVHTWIRDYILQNCHRGEVNLADLRRSGRRQFDELNHWQQINTVLSAMELLERSHWVVRLDDRSGEHQGRAQWGVNPQLAVQFKEERRRVIEAKQRVLDRIQQTATTKRKVAGYDDVTAG